MKKITIVFAVLCFVGLIVVVAVLWTALSRQENRIQQICFLQDIHVFDIVVDRDYPSSDVKIVAEKRGEPPQTVFNFGKGAPLRRGRYWLLLSGLDKPNTAMAFNGEVRAQFAFFPESQEIDASGRRRTSGGYSTSFTPQKVRSGDVAFSLYEKSDPEGEPSSAKEINVRVFVGSDTP